MMAFPVSIVVVHTKITSFKSFSFLVFFLSFFLLVDSIRETRVLDEFNGTNSSKSRREHRQHLIELIGYDRILVYIPMLDVDAR